MNERFDKILLGNDSDDSFLNNLDDLDKIYFLSKQNHQQDVDQQSLPLPLNVLEKKFLLAVERGDLPAVKRIICIAPKDKFNINCCDPLGRSGLLMAIDNENLEMIELLLSSGVEMKDALLHAINEEFVEAVELLLDHENLIHVPGTPHSWEAFERETFTSDITPLVLAAHRNNYEIIKIILDRNISPIPIPHAVRCGCKECRVAHKKDCLRHSRSRINAYKALSSPSLIALYSKDPILTAFELGWQLKRLSFLEPEFKYEYQELRKQCHVFATALLDHTRTTEELEILLNYDPQSDPLEMHDKMQLCRLKLAIRIKQKMFCAHANVQQLLASIWYEGLPGFRRKNILLQVVQLFLIGALFPIFSLAYIIWPYSLVGKFIKQPFIKFICHSASYVTFLVLLMLASQRIESNIFGIDPMDQTSSNSNSSTDAINSNSTKRGSLPSYIELLILFWVFGLIWSEIKQLWDLGITEYLSDMWNILDFINNSIYVATIALRIIAYCQTQKEISIGQSNLAYHRDKWDDFDPILLSEGLFATANIFSSLKLVYIFSINPYLGPLQISLGRMVIDILKFFSIYLLVLFSFACGMNQLLWYYADMEKQSCSMQQSNTQNLLNSNATLTLEERFETNTLIIDMLHPNACFTWRRFANLFESTQTLFWATFGLIDLDIFELTGIKSYTRFWGLLMFGVYCIINVAVLLNLLIAMMNHSYQLISEQADTEWKFARSKLWISYFSDGATVPPPFNIIPTPKSILTFLHWFSTLFYQTRKAKNEAIRTTKKKQQKANERDVKYFKVVRSLVRRYVMNEQRIQERQRGVTEDDCNEIKQEISALRYNLLELLGARKKNNIINGGCSLLGKKGRQRERRLIKGFNFDVVKDDAQENVVDDDDDIDNGGATVSKQSKHTKNENNISNHLDNDTRHQSQRSKRSSFHQSNSSLVNILNRNRAANRFYKVAQNYKKIKGARWKQLLEVTTRTKVKPSSQSQMLPRPSILPPLSSRSFRSQNSIDGDNFVDHLNDDRQNFTLDRRPASIRRKMFARRTDTMATSTTSQPIIFESDHHRKQLALIDADDDDDDDDNFNADHNDLFDLKIIDKNLRNTFIDEKWI